MNMQSPATNPPCEFVHRQISSGIIHNPRSRFTFLNFINKLKLVLSTVAETVDMLQDPGNPTKPSTKAASQAVFRMLCARVDSYLITQLQDLAVRLGREDGYQALMLLRSFFADAEDIDYQHNIMNHFKALSLQEGESVCHESMA